MNIENVNLTDYPIDRPDCAQYRSLVSDLRERLSVTGLVNLEAFLTPEGVGALREETDEKAPDE